MLALRPTAAFEDLPAPDVIVVPGGVGTRACSTTSASRWLRRGPRDARVDDLRLHGLARARRGRPAAGLDRDDALARARDAARFGAEPTVDRVVEHRARSSPPPACPRASTWPCGWRPVPGDDFARAIQLLIEYDPQPPFDSGSTAKAGPGLTGLIRERAASFR